MFWLARLIRLLRPMPPTPMPAMFSVSLGGVNPRPRTRRGTMANAAPLAATLVRNLRREISFFSSFSCVAAPISSGQTPRSTISLMSFPPCATGLGLRNLCGGFVRVDTLLSPGVHCSSHIIIGRMVLHVQIVKYEVPNDRRIDLLVTGPFHCALVNVVADHSRSTGLPGQRHPMGVPWES